MASDTPIKESIIRELGLGKLSPEGQEVILNKIAEALLKRMYLETFEKLEENDRSELMGMLGGDPEIEEVEMFVQSKVPDYGEAMSKIVEDFKGEFKESMAFALSA